MWEQIRANQRRSALLITLMGGLLALMGYALGEVGFGPGAGLIGLAVALIIFLVQLAIYYAAAESVLLAGMGARELSRDDMPRLFNIVEEMKLASGLPFMPKVYLIDNPSPNAFAIGRKPETSAVAVTSGLLYRLNRDELQGVIAHEIAHLKNRDTHFMTLAGVMLGSIIMLSELTWRMLRYGGFRAGSRSRSRSGSSSGQAQLIILLVAVVVAILGPIVAQILYFATSRKREFLADACAAQYTRYPEGLASALERIAATPSRLVVSKAVAPMFIVNPLSGARGETSSLFSTHPPTFERVCILRSMAGAGLGDYEAAYRAVRGGGLIGGASLKAAPIVTPRAASGEGPIESRPETRMAIQRLAGYVSVPCACGMEARVPEGFEGDSVRCPRCGSPNPIPGAVAAGVAAQAGADTGRQEAPLEFLRRGGSWETFRCGCGASIQLSPSFCGARVRCGRCGRHINVKQAA
ncbi:MAG: M48 family metallopeptidase [Candidatus Sumerlaeaceae bacterium]|nr:M48 family metallopeptidase [Candidatus Sumerlaeaceae bacterium]